MFSYEKDGYGLNNHLLPELDRLSQPVCIDLILVIQIMYVVFNYLEN